MHVFIEIPSGSQPISNLLLGENFRLNFLPMLNFRKIYNPTYRYIGLSLTQLMYAKVRENHTSTFWERTSAAMLTN